MKATKIAAGTAKFAGRQVIRPYAELGKSGKSLAGTLAWSWRTVRETCRQPEPDAIQRQASKLFDQDADKEAARKAKFEYLARERGRSVAWMERQLRQCRILHAGMVGLSTLCTTFAVGYALFMPGEPWANAVLALIFLLGAAISTLTGVRASLGAYCLQEREAATVLQVPWQRILLPADDGVPDHPLPGTDDGAPAHLKIVS